MSVKNYIEIYGDRYDLADGVNLASSKEESSTAAYAHGVGERFLYMGELYEATQAIAVGGTITPNSNCKRAHLGDEVAQLKSAVTYDSAFLNGAGNTYTSISYGNVIAGHTYRVYPLSWDVSTVSDVTSYTKFDLGYTNNGVKTTVRTVYGTSTVLADYYDVTIPDTAVSPTLVIGGRVSTGKTGVVRIADISLDIVVEKQGQRIGSANLLDYFEVGGINISTSGWSYGSNPSRVRTKREVTFHLYPGDRVGLSDYTNSRFYTGFRKTDGTYNLFAWRTSDLTITTEGYYVFLIANTTDTVQTDKTALGSLFFGYDGVAYDGITANMSAIKDMSTIHPVLMNGYLNVDGNLSTDITTGNPVSTDFIPLSVGNSLHISFEFSAIQQMWFAYCFYDSNKKLVGSRIVDINSVNYEAGNVYIKNRNDAVRYVRVSFRTYNDISVSFEANSFADINSLRLDDIDDRLLIDIAKLNENVKGINHRGYNSLFPENTLQAFLESRKRGYAYVETDVRFTSDGVPVLLHDASINRTARNSDGTEISGTVNIADITYADAQTYDFGIYKGTQFAGLKIPTLEEFLKLCRSTGLRCYIELKAGTQPQIESLVQTVRGCGMIKNATWISDNYTYLSYVKDIDTQARLGLIKQSFTSSTAESLLLLKTDNNEVFADLYYYASDLADQIEIAKQYKIPVETWTPNASTTIINADPYITGMTTDYNVAGYVLFNNAIRS